MALYPRLIGDAAPKIPIHAFQSILAEWARGKITGAQAQAIVTSMSGPLDAQEQADAQALVASVTNIAVPAAPAPLGNNPAANALRDYTLAWANRLQGLAQRAQRVTEIDQVLLLVDARAPGYQTEAEVRAKLGV